MAPQIGCRCLALDAVDETRPEPTLFAEAGWRPMFRSSRDHRQRGCDEGPLFVRAER
ncbi:hypothetical protein DPMN_088120 [Dreissena polymorpha]|uniref:Uncharacterized protein n=1 Tax=Dreissena polymorpha TaxID=45954 RepID=A0A9D4J8Z0_DREPO|nr:hypothetical protein DPMN_153497 [Dreissena polymorpha]KAH3845830.1 hypothetical protein DPMN_088120 [Dreissena polymorpha]